MPVLNSGLAFQYITFTNGLLRFSFFLIVASTFRDHKNLATRMAMPIQTRTWIKGSECNAIGEDTVCRAQFVQPNISVMVNIGSFFSFRENSAILCKCIND